MNESEPRESPRRSYVVRDGEVVEGAPERDSRYGPLLSVMLETRMMHAMCRVFSLPMIS